MDITELNQYLSERALEVCQYLFPNGHTEGNEYCVGSLSGEAGKSLKIHLSGAKAGVYKDFASSDPGGDLIDLWKNANNQTLPEALKDIKIHFGITDNERYLYKQTKKTYSRPDPQKVRNLRLHDEIKAYLLNRKISETTLNTFFIKTAVKVFPLNSQNGKNNGHHNNGNGSINGESVMVKYVYYPYIRDNELINWKFLPVEREYRSKYTQTFKGGEKTLFGWQVVDTMPDLRQITITEGEIDCLSWYEYNCPALSVPFGGGTGGKHDWIENDWEKLERFEKIYISMDMDQVGRDAAQEIAYRLGYHRCFYVELPKGHKDCNDCLKAGITKREMAEALSKAKYFSLPDLKSAAEYRDQVIEEFYPDPNKPATGFPLTLSEKAKNIKFQYGEVTIWSGQSGSGKSVLLNQVALDGISQGEKFCLASFEMKPKKTLKIIVKQALKKELPSHQEIMNCFSWLADKLFVYDRLGSANIETMMQVFLYARKRYGVRYFIIDSLAKCGIREEDYSRQKEFVEMLTDFCNEHEVHINLVVHQRKRESEYHQGDKTDVKGTGAITDLAHIVLLLWRNKRKEEAIEDGDPSRDHEADAILTCKKQRETGWEGKIGLLFNNNCQQFYTENNQNINYYLGTNTMLGYEKYIHSNGNNGAGETQEEIKISEDQGLDEEPPF